MGKAIGIDLGTTNSVVAYKDTAVKVIQTGANNEDLCRSCVALDKSGQFLVGNAVYKNWKRYSPNIVVSVKRLMGTGFSDPRVQKMRADSNAYPYGIKKPSGGTEEAVAIVLRGKEYSPEQISGEILKALKTDANTKLGDVTHAVITVPAYFTEKQKTATKKAAELAGLHVQRLLAEPTAAAISYGFDQMMPGESKQVLVYDFGGGTFDTSLLHCSNKRYEVICTQGSSCLGSSDLLEALVEYVVDYCAKYYDLEVDISKCLPQRKYYQDFRSDCEMARISLSSTEVVTINLKNLFKLATNVPKDACEEFTLTRLEYEQLIRPYIDKTFVCIDKLLKEANEICGVTEDKISLVVLVGGTTRTPYIQKRVYERFCGHTVQDINPEECVARGACIYCMKQNQVDISDQALGSISISDHASFSYGIAVQGGRVCRLISKGDMIPVVKSNTFTTTEDNQQYISTAVYIGEGMQISDCRFLHELKFGPIEQRPKGVPKISITYKIDLATMLTVICEEKTDSASIKLVGKVEVKVGSSVC